MGEARKAPEIHLGYFTRIKGLWNLLQRVVSLCVDADSSYQVINLGAGYDTLYWRLKAAPAGKVILQNLSKSFNCEIFRSNFSKI